MESIEHRIANAFADRMQKDLERFKERMSEQNFVPLEFRGIFKSNSDGTLRLVRQKPFVND